VIALTAFISPLRADRARVRALMAPGDFVEIYCQADLAVCEARDVKGLYRRARSGEIPEFTGISSPYEEPAAPELAVPTGAEPLEASVQRVIRFLETTQRLPQAPQRLAAGG
jgi:adenylylsulfate kinase